MKKRQAWTAEDDQRLKYLYENNKFDWYHIADLFQNRNHKQCKERYFQHVKPGLQQKKLSTYEIQLLFTLLKKNKYKWSKIVSRFKNRTILQIKNCFYTIIRRTLRRLFKAIGYKQTTQIVNMFKSKFLTSFYTTQETLNIKYQFQQLINDFKMMKVKQIQKYGDLEQIKCLLESIIKFNHDNYQQGINNQQFIINKIKNREQIFKIINQRTILHSPQSERIDYLQDSIINYFGQ